MPKILTAAVTNQKRSVLDAHLKTIRWQTIKSDLYYILDGADPEVGIGEDIVVHEADKKPGDAAYAADATTHQWNIPTFHWLATQRQHLLDYAKEHGYDYIWIVDSDLLFDKRTLASLLSVKKPVVSAVFWTNWQPDSPPQPQVWLTHPYGLSNGQYTEQEFLSALDQRQLVKVHGLGASTLIRSDVFNFVQYYPLLDGLPADGMWQGEDRHFCIGAERNHVPLYADGWPEIFHVYRPADEAAIEGWIDACDKATIEGPPSAANWINLTIEPLDVPPLHGMCESVRGPFASLRLMPEITEALTQMKVGEEKFVYVSFPPWYDLIEYRGTRHLFRVRLIDIK